MCKREKHKRKNSNSKNKRWMKDHRAEVCRRISKGITAWPVFSLMFLLLVKVRGGDRIRP